MNQDAALPTPVGMSSAEAKPKWLVPVVVSAIVIGSLFGCCGLASIGGAAANRAIQETALQAQLSVVKDPGAAEAMRRLGERNLAFQAKLLPFTVTAGVLGLLHSIALVVAGILAHKRRKVGLRLLGLVCAVGIGVELINGSLGFYAARETSAYTTGMMQSMLAMQNNGSTQLNEQTRQTMQQFTAGATRVGTAFGFVMLLGFFTIKTGYYIACVLYLRRPEVVAYFRAAPT